MSDDDRTKPDTRLYVLQARKAPRAVIFRRGPSKQVRLVLWDTARDRFLPGQWLKGRVYERRSDLSPDGRYLAYFAAKHKPDGPPTWTAVSRPPYFTAIALWPKTDAWGGGALFKDDKTLLLNHHEGNMKVQTDGWRNPPIRVRPLGDSPGAGEDDPIWSMRLERDGWKLVQEGETHEDDRETADIWIRYDPPEVWRRAAPKRQHRLELEMRLCGIRERGGAWYVIEYSIVGAGDERVDLGRADWADWCRTSGDLLFARDGKIQRLPVDGALPDPARANALTDLSDQTFEEMEPPPEALEWGGRIHW